MESIESEREELESKAGKERRKESGRQREGRKSDKNRNTSDMELGHWVTGSMGHLSHLSRPGHRVIIFTRCETRVFQVFENPR